MDGDGGRSGGVGEEMPLRKGVEIAFVIELGLFFLLPKARKKDHSDSN